MKKKDLHEEKVKNATKIVQLLVFDYLFNDGKFIKEMTEEINNINNKK